MRSSHQNWLQLLLIWFERVSNIFLSWTSQTITYTIKFSHSNKHSHWPCAGKGTQHLSKRSLSYKDTIDKEEINLGHCRGDQIEVWISNRTPHSPLQVAKYHCLALSSPSWLQSMQWIIWCHLLYGLGLLYVLNLLYVVHQLSKTLNLECHDKTPDFLWH